MLMFTLYFNVTSVTNKAINVYEYKFLLVMKFCEDTTGKYIRENSQKKNSNNQNTVPIFKVDELIT